MSKWDKVFMNGKMEILTLETSQMTWEMEEEFIVGKMEVSYQDIGGIISSTGKSNTPWVEINIISKLHKARLSCDTLQLINK